MGYTYTTNFIIYLKFKFKRFLYFIWQPTGRVEGESNLKQKGQRPFQVGSSLPFKCLLTSPCILPVPTADICGLFNNLIAPFIYIPFVRIFAGTPSKPRGLNFIMFLISQVKNRGLEKWSHTGDCDPTVTSNRGRTLGSVRTSTWHLARV